MRRRLLNVLTAIALLLPVVAAGFWARSYFASDEVLWTSASARRASAWSLMVRSDTGILRIEWEEMWWPSADPTDPIRQQVLAARGFSFGRGAPGRPVAERGMDAATAFGERWSYSGGRTRFSGRSVILPYWLALGAACAIPVPFVWLLHRRRLRRMSGLCPRCGYDLRATPSRCPECGASPAAAPAPI